MPWAFFLNPFLLLGLVGIALPVIAHLLSRRKYDVVDWGAMQFLNPSRKSRRKMRLEELLLLLVRIMAIALIATALARPSISSGFLLGYNSAGSRDVVLVIDGSNSMSRTDGLTSLHQKAIRRAKEFLLTLNPGDTVAIIDARDVPVKILESPVQDRQLVAKQLDNLPPPAGAANVRLACEEAIGILGRCSNGSREIVVLTDRQRASWTLNNEAAWRRFDEVLKFPSVRPGIWVLDVAQGLAEIRQNVSVGQIAISRDLTVPDFPVSLQVSIRNAGAGPVDVPVQVLINGQRVANYDATVSVSARSDATYSRTLRFRSEGTNLVTVKAVATRDAIESDNQSHAAIKVTSAIPVLLIESSTSPDRTRWNSFFAELALTAPQNDSPWILARTVKARNLQHTDLDAAGAVVLADVTELPDNISAAIQEFVAGGKGVLIALGERSKPDAFQTMFVDTGLLPAVKLKRIRSTSPDAPLPTTIAPYSLEAAWLDRFRERKGASLLQANYDKWWTVEQISASPTEQAALPDAVAEDQRPPIRNRNTYATVAQLTSGDPLLLQTSCGEGSVLLMTSNLNADWNALPTRPDYVPFLHEALFQLVAAEVRRNVPFGSPLMTVKEDDSSPGSSFEFAGPFDRVDSAIMLRSGGKISLQLPRTRLPGVYTVGEVSQVGVKTQDTFVVNYNHDEDNPAELLDEDTARLTANGRISFVPDAASLKKQMYGDESRSELWWLLLFIFLILLTVEVWMTRRLVLQGHADPPSLSYSDLR